MTETTRLNWFVNVLQLDGSVLPKILPRIALFVGLSLLMVATYKAGLWHNSENMKAFTNNVACNLVLGLLLVFRTNTAYERYWNGRIAWGTLVITTRNLAREIQVAIATPDEKSKAEKKKALKRLVGFAITTKCFLRQESPVDQLKNLLDDDDIAQIEKAERPPQLITFWLSHYLQQQHEQGHISGNQRIEGNSQVNRLVEALSGCERIIKTPMPMSYKVYLRRLTLLYCLLLPLGLVEQLGWWTPSAIAIVSFILLGVEEIGNAIENPFGYGFNNIKLDSICNTLLKDIQTTLAFGADGVLGEETDLVVVLNDDVPEMVEAA
ncbi:MAG: bestrophin family ion channel [Phormidesmis sp.]